MAASDTDTISAIATAVGRSGIGIVRVSGSRSKTIAESILGFSPTPRYAHYCNFKNAKKQIIDSGLALFFPAPRSFTGEDVLELHGHGGYFLLDRLLNTTVEYGCRLAKPGEFSERSFLNNKMDLTQAEAVADLIDCSSEQAARSAIRTLQGDFSKVIRKLCTSIVDLRVYIEAAIDFSEEEIDFLSEGKTTESMQAIIENIDQVFEQARQGSLLKEGMAVVIAGKPNAGKSSLLNSLAGKESAIVTDIAGTTRDILREQINIDGMPVHVIDTAGIHNSTNKIEKEGIRRAYEAIKSADRILLVVDSCADQNEQEINNSIELITADTDAFSTLEDKYSRVTIIYNKIDLSGKDSGLFHMQLGDTSVPVINLSAKNQIGLSVLRDHLKDCMGYKSTVEGGFMARRRHLDSLTKARQCLLQAQIQLEEHRAGELVAEDLRQAHKNLGEIIGEFTTDDLLGKIFSSFCVGK